MLANTNEWYFSWLPAVAGSGKDRAALVKGAKWVSGDIITISFLDGDPAVQERVREVAQQWVTPGMANLVFDFRKNAKQNTLIRISFAYEGSWSAIGTACKRITDKQEPTMNFGWLTRQTPDEKLERVVLHEFGHALGLIHEHQHPTAGINWNREAVIADLKQPPNIWTLEDIEHNMFEAYRQEETNFSKPDPQSIMMYPIPEHWTLDGFSVGLNTTLSPTDKRFIRDQYS